MKKTLLFLYLILVALLPGTVSSQPKTYSVRNAHAHNDYLHPVPFLTAFEAGFGSIEADVYPIEGRLYVAHSKKEIDLERSLRTLYIDPILKTLPWDRSRKLILLIDIKENYPEAMAALIRELEPLKPLFRKKQLQMIISGLRPTPTEFRNYPRYISFDDDQSRESTRKQWKRVGMVSLRFSNLSKWKGTGAMPAEDEVRLRSTIDSVHRAGKIIRFWGAPDNSASWNKQMELGADLIGTDKIAELRDHM